MKFCKLRFKTVFITITLFLLLFRGDFVVHSQEIVDKDIPNIILITLSGLRNSESIEDPVHQYMPYLWNAMRKEGVLYTNLLDLNKQFHAPTVKAIITGENYSFFPEEGVSKPSIFQYVRKKYALERSKLWVIENWRYNDCVCKNNPEFSEDTYPCQLTSLPLAGSSASEAYQTIVTEQGIMLEKFINKLADRAFLGIKAYAFYVHWDSLDTVFYQYFKKILQKFKPKLTYYMMGAIDSAHYDTFARYALALKKSDERIFKIWQMIKNDPFYKDNTYLIVCVDHQRNSYYMRHDENAQDNPSRVWMYIYGPDIRRGVTIERRIHHVDIFATLAYIMEVKTHPSKGSILKDCFRTNNR